jgi:hypothetical protein
MTDEELQAVIVSLATNEDIRAEGERLWRFLLRCSAGLQACQHGGPKGPHYIGVENALREHMTRCMERAGRDTQALINAIEFMKHLDS